MSATQRPMIPYEAQTDAQNSRMCGAASLSMVYRSFGTIVPQAEIWPGIAKRNRLNSLAAATHLIAQDALNRGFAALVIQAKHPLQALHHCLDNGIRAILNHRLKDDLPTGHFTVLVDIDEDHVVLHDPYLGASRRVSHTELLELWRPRYLQAEIAGNMLIGLAPRADAVPACPLCQTVIPASVACPNCQKPVPLQPAALLGCVGTGCVARMWNYIACPFCDHTWNFGLEGPQPQQTAGPEEDLGILNPLCAEVDKFCAQILSLPAAANHSDLQKLIAFLKTSKDKLKLAQTEELARRKVQTAQVAQLQEKFKREQDAIGKKTEEINTPAPFLDGNALGLALLKDLGFQEVLPQQATLPPPPAAQPAPPRPAAQVTKPEPQDEPAKVEYEAPNWDTLDVRE